MKEQLTTFRSQLVDFARKHKNDIRKNPAFRSQSHQMCAKIGVDPLASNKGSGLSYWELVTFIMNLVILIFYTKSICLKYPQIQHETTFFFFLLRCC
ncbi:hypothetical protein MKX03_010943 [Papaver bracteatum]|nr:hypothetical protein MKX03_010943 [Papaver bracteatum]